MDQIRPESVHLYGVQREPARRSLRAVPEPVLREIADRVSALGVRAQVFA